MAPATQGSVRKAVIFGLRWLVGVVVLVTFAFVTVQIYQQHKINQTMVRGNRIVAALDAYRLAHGKYPEALAELVPKYLNDVPRPSVDSAWDYSSLNNGDRFWLSFDGVGMHPGRAYLHDRGWKKYGI